MSETKGPEVDFGVVSSYDEAEQMLSERWDDPRAGEQNPLVIIHVRPGANQVIMAWLVATFMAAWERCARVFAKKASSAALPCLRVLFWSGGTNELPCGRTVEEWQEKSVLSIGLWEAWMDDSELVSVIRCLYGEEQLPGDFGRALQFVFRWCDRVYSDQQAHNLQVAYDVVVKEEGELIGPEGKTVKAVLIPATERALASVSLERGVALLAIRESDGRVTVSWNARFGLAHIKTVARAVGIEERRANRTLTFGEIVGIAAKVLNPNSWEPGFALNCRGGICGSGCDGRPICPRVAWHIERCAKCKFESEATPRVMNLAAQPKAMAPALVAKPAPTMEGESQAETPAAQPKAFRPTPSV